MITILLIIFLCIIICYTFRIYKLKKEGFSIFDGSFFDFGQQKMFMEYRKGGPADQIDETNKGFTHEIKNIVGELGSSGQQMDYQGVGSFSQNLDTIQTEMSINIADNFKNASKIDAEKDDRLKYVGTYAMNNFITKDEAFAACFDNNDTWTNDNYAVLVSGSEKKETNLGQDRKLYKPNCVGVAYSGPNQSSPNGTFYLLGKCVKKGEEGKGGDCGFYMDDGKKGKTFFNGMDKVPNPWKPVGQNATTFFPMIIDNVWYMDKKVQGSVNLIANEIPGPNENLENVLKIAVLDPKSYDNLPTMITKAREICKQGLLAGFKRVEGDSEKGEKKWFADPEQGTYKNVQCVGFSVEGVKPQGSNFSSKPTITFYGIPESNLNGSFKKVKLDLDTAVENTLPNYIFEETGNLDNKYKILNAVNTDINGKKMSCNSPQNCEEMCETTGNISSSLSDYNLSEEDCIGYQQIPAPTPTYRLLRNGLVTVNHGSFTDTDNLEKQRDVYKYVTKYDTLTKKVRDIENSNENNKLFSTIINSNDNYKDIIENEKNNVDALIANLKNLLDKTDPDKNEDLTKCEVLKELKKYHVQYHRFYKNGSDDRINTKDRQGKKIGLMPYYEDSFKDMEINQIRKSSGNETNMSLISKRGVSNNWWERLANFFSTNRDDQNRSFLENIILSGTLKNTTSETRELAIKKLLQQNYINIDNWAIKEVDGQGDLYTGSEPKAGAVFPICKGEGKLGTKTRGCDLSNVELTNIGINKNFDNTEAGAVSSYEDFFNILNNDCGLSDDLGNPLKPKCITYSDISNITIEFDGYYNKGWAFQNNGNYSFDNLNLKTGNFKNIDTDLSCNVGSGITGSQDDVNINSSSLSGSNSNTVTFKGCEPCQKGFQKNQFSREKCVDAFGGGCQ